MKRSDLMPYKKFALKLTAVLIILQILLMPVAAIADTVTDADISEIGVHGALNISCDLGYLSDPGDIGNTGDFGDFSEMGGPGDTGDTDAGVSNGIDVGANVDAGGEEPVTEAEVDAAEFGSAEDLEFVLEELSTAELETLGLSEAQGGNSYKVEITPGALVDGVDTEKSIDFFISFTELSPLMTFGSAKVEIPSEFVGQAFDPTSGINVTSADSSVKNWYGELLGSFLTLWAVDADSYLMQNESVSATFTVLTPDDGQRGIYTLKTEAWTEANADFDGVADDPLKENILATGYSDPVVVVGIGIDSASDLAKIGNDPDYLLNDFYVQTADIDLTSYLSADGDGWNGGAGWEPIGNSANPANRFSGAYHGNGYIIENLFINRPATDYVGLFARTVASSLLNSVALDSVSIIGSGHTGGLVGDNNGTIINSFVSGSVTGGSRVGGMIGANYGVGIVTYSYADVAVNGNWHVGGLVGLNYGFISDCYAASNVIGNNSNIGGLVGQNEGGIASSHAAGNVIGSLDNVGGLVGLNTGNGIISNSYASGNIVGTRWRIGGLVGYNENTADISSSYATGDVSGTNSVGGLVGHNDNANIENSYAAGSVQGSGFRIGGLVGFSEKGSSITGCFATGSSKGNNNVGGLVGENWDSAITDCYAAGRVEGNDNRIGGLVGWNRGSITNAYATGFVVGASDLGGLVGTNSGSVIDGYYDRETTGQSDTGKGDPKITEEMRQTATFTPFWNISAVGGEDTTWRIYEGSTYPLLRWAMQDGQVSAVKTYDGTTTIAAGDFDPAVNIVGLTVMGTFDDSNAGSGKPVTLVFDSTLDTPELSRELQWYDFLSTGTINRAPLAITADSFNKTHGSSYSFTGAEFAVSGLVGGDSVDSADIASAGAPAAAPLGTYPISITNATGSAGLDDNYIITYFDGVLTVVPESATPPPSDPFPHGLLIDMFWPDMLILETQKPFIQLYYLIIPWEAFIDSWDGLITDGFVRRGTAEDLKAATRIYSYLRAQFEADRYDYSDPVYASALLDLAATWAAIQTRAVLLLNSLEDESKLVGAAVAYDKAADLLAEYGDLLAAAQVEAIKEVLTAIEAELIAFEALLPKRVD